MKKSIWALIFFIVVVFGCFAQEMDALLQVTNVVNAYLGQLTNRFSAYKATSEIRKLLSHNDSIPAEAQWKYDAIKEEMLPIEPGGYVCTNVTVIKTLKDHIWVNRMRSKSQKEDTYFVLIRYTIIASYAEPKKGQRRQLVVYDSPRSYERYLVIAKDWTDGIFKLIDVYPRVAGELDFYTIPTILAHPEVSISSTDRDLLCGIFLSRQ